MARHGAYAGFLAAVAASIVASGCCTRRAPAARESVVHVERRDTVVYRPAYSLEATLYLSESGKDSAFTRTVRDSATRAALAITYQPATRTVHARVTKEPEAITIPRVRESTTVKETIALPCPPPRAAWWRVVLGFVAGMITGVAGVGLFRALVR